MKNIIILLILVLFPIVGFSSIDEYKTDVYFANGIDMDEGNATANTLLLENSIKEKFYKNSAIEMNKYIAKVAESYNHTDNIVLDFWESILWRYKDFRCR